METRVAGNAGAFTLRFSVEWVARQIILAIGKTGRSPDPSGAENDLPGLNLVQSGSRHLRSGSFLSLDQAADLSLEETE